MSIAPDTESQGRNLGQEDRVLTYPRSSTKIQDLLWIGIDRGKV